MKKIYLLVILCFCIGVRQSRAQDVLTYAQSLKNGNGISGLTGVSDIVVSPDGKFVYSAGYLASGCIAWFERNPLTGTLSFSSYIQQNVNGITGIQSAFSLVISPDNKSLYVASPSGNITAFSRNVTTGALSFVNTVSVGSAGNTMTTKGFVSVSISPNGKWVYGIGAQAPKGLAVFTRNETTGAIIFLEQHLDGVNGNALDQDYSPTGSPIKNIATSSDGKWLYVSSTLDNAVSLFMVDQTTGKLTLQKVYQDGVGGVDGLLGASSLLLSSDGKNLYASGQKENSIGYFSVNQLNGELTYLTKVTHNVNGITTLNGVRSLAINPDGKYLYASAITSNSVTVFSRNALTGDLTLNKVATDGVAGVDGLSAASGMSTDPLNRNLYVAGQSDAGIAVFRLPIPAVILSQNEVTTSNGIAVVLDAALEIYDSDSQNLKSATVKIGNGFVNTDVLAVTVQYGISSSYNASTGVLSLTGVATMEQYRDVLRTLQYTPGADLNAPAGSISNRTLNIGVSDAEDNQSSEVTILVKVSGSLPVSFGSFSVSRQGNKAKLSWNTLSEQNSKFFTVFRSADGVTYKEIAQVAAQGNSNVLNTYTILDNSPVNGSNYYLLKQTDIDGKIYELDQKTLRFSFEEATVQVWPNPVDKLLNVSFKAGLYQQLQLSNMNGQVLVSQTLSGTTANTSVLIEAYPKGLYVLTLIGTKGDYKLKIVK